MKPQIVRALGLLMLLSSAGCESQSPPKPPASLPEWLRDQIRAGGQLPPAVERVTYLGQPAYHTIATDRYDTGDEHSLFSSNGTLICRFGGMVGQVTSGSCEIDKIVYVSTLYDPG